MRCSIRSILLTIALSAFVPLSAMAATSEARKDLNSILPEINFNNVHLSDALDFLSQTSGANILVDWKTLETAKIDKDTPVTLSLHNVRMEKILSEILDQASDNALTYYVDDNVIEITTRAAADQKLVTVVYDIMDLISLDDNFNGILSGGLSLSGAGSGGSGGSSSALTNSSNNTSSTTTPADKADQLIKLIQSTVRPDIWKSNGGPATIEYFNGQLIVTAPRSVQEAIGGPLE
jgi:type II secretory pathway component GspD/PulD (secretin)